MWFNLKEQRLQTLWKAMEVIGRTRVDNYYRAAKAAERSALKATSEAAGFGSTLRHIDRATKQIIATLEVKEKEVRARAEEEAIAQAMKLQKQTRRVQDAANTVLHPNSKTSSSKPGSGPSSTGKTPKLGSTMGKTKRTSMRWYHKMEANPFTKEKFHVLLDLLHMERHRHVLDLVEQAKRNVHVHATGGRAPVVDMNSLRDFLLAAPGSEEEANINLYEDEDGGGAAGGSERKVETSSDSTKDQKHGKTHAGQKDHHPPKGQLHSHHSSRPHHARVIHPRFNMLGFGILDYFRHCPLSFFKGIVEGFE